MIYDQSCKIDVNQKIRKLENNFVSLDLLLDNILCIDVLPQKRRKKTEKVGDSMLLQQWARKACSKKPKKKKNRFIVRVCPNLSYKIANIKH